MAAKQGLTAQIHQYSEDTKRSLLSRAPAGIKSHSWLSNLNTTCTIKSAPPRTPEVMSMLGTKCGWLAKRNEQHVWQKRWCCVVPHTFLYYFEASPMEVKPDDEDGNIQTHEAWSGGGININVFVNMDQEALNAAVKDGYDEAGGANSGGKMSLYASLPNIMGGGGGPAGDGNSPNADDSMVAWDPENNPMISPVAGDTDASKGGAYQFTASSNLQPVGIIDLECYSAVNRSKINPTVLELAGDAVTNPDLRSFYFQSPNIEEAESWTKALLSDRHCSLKDETEAYRQVCESFPLQLANCSQMIDAAEAKAEAMEREAYSVRCAGEEGRRKVVAAVREMLERRCWETEASRKKGLNSSPFGTMGGKPGGLEIEESKTSGGANGEKSGGLLDSALDKHFEKLETNREAFLRELEAALSSPGAVATSNVLPPVQTLVDYTSAIVGSFSDLRTQLQKYERELSTTVQQDQSQLEALKSAIEGRNAQLAEAEKKHTAITLDLRSELDAARTREEELTKQLETQRMEFGMYQNATKTKLSELGQHKKILKREVIELRKKIDESGSENTAVAHEYEKMKSSYKSMKDKNETLERYIDRLEKQVGVQQNMMEMMSQTGGASIVGKMVGPGVAGGDSKDAVSLSGMSMGSQYRKLNGTASTLGGGDYGGGGAKSTSYAAQRPRPLLPPEHSPAQPPRGASKSVHDVSPLPTPTFKGGEEKGLDTLRGAAAAFEGEDDTRDPSTVYHTSETTTEAGRSPGAENEIGDVAVASPNRTPAGTPSRSQSGEDQAANAETECDQDMILATRSGTSGDIAAASPRSIDERSERSLRADPSHTPVQSNGFVEAVARDILGKEPEVPHVKSLENLPSLDSDAKGVLDVTESIEGSPVVSNLPPARSPDVEDDDDNASRVSDITEDRTQRQIDDDLAERRKILLAYVNKTSGSSAVSLSNASAQRRLETIENMLPSMAESQDGTSVPSGRSGRLSVAQRARLDAENRSNTHRATSPNPSRGREDSSQRSGGTSVTSGRQHSGPSSVASQSDTVGRSGSFFKNIGKAIEKAVDNSVLGIGPTDDDDYYDESESEIMSSVVSEASTTLQERIAMQRERQVAFLKAKGMLDDESSLRGGAGASPNSKAPTPRRSTGSLSVRSLTGRSPSARSSSGSSGRWSPRVNVAQDEV